MNQRIRHNSLIPLAWAISLLLAAGSLLNGLGASLAWGVTAAEKRAEADGVYAQIDSLQTSLNAVMDEYNMATAAHDEAVRLSEDAAARIEKETERLESLQGELSEFAVGMYKEGGAGTFLDVLLQTTSFEAFLTSFDFCSSISAHGSSLIQQTRETRERQEEAKALYEEQSARALEQMEIARASMDQIESTQAALRAEAEKITAEAAELQAQEELAAEAARQAEEARRQREAEIAAGTAGNTYVAGESVIMGDGFFTNPCPEAVSSSGFGYRSFDNSFHKGTDMAAPEGTPYYAAADGTVMYATNDGGYNGGAGNWVVISHGNGIVTKYMHSSATFVRPGDYVTRGQNIGTVGNTGQSFGAHLHFQVEVDGVAVNPHNYF